MKNKKILSSILMGITFATMGVPSTAKADIKNVESSKAITSLYNAFENKDSKQASKIAKDLRYSSDKEEIQLFNKLFKDPNQEITDYKILEENKISDDEYQYTVKTSYKNGFIYDEKLNVVNENGKWQVITGEENSKVSSIVKVGTKIDYVQDNSLKNTQKGTWNLDITSIISSGHSSTKEFTGTPGKYIVNFQQKSYGSGTSFRYALCTSSLISYSIITSLTVSGTTEYWGSAHQKYLTLDKTYNGAYLRVDWMDGAYGHSFGEVYKQ